MGSSIIDLWAAELAMGDQRSSALTTTWTPISAVMSEVSEGGETSTTSNPHGALRADQAEQLQRLARQEAAGLGRAGAGHEAAIQRVHVEGNINGVGALPGQLQRDLRRLLDAEAARCRRWSARWRCAGGRPGRPRAALASGRCRAAPGSPRARWADWWPRTTAWGAGARRGPFLDVDVAVD